MLRFFHKSRIIAVCGLMVFSLLAGAALPTAHTAYMPGGSESALSQGARRCANGSKAARRLPDNLKVIQTSTVEGMENAEEAIKNSEEQEEAKPYLTYHEEGYYSLGESGVITTPDGTELKYSDVLTCSATAYTTERQENKITATGTVAHVGGIAVDPKLIPYGTRMYIVSARGTWTYGLATAEDCGGGVKGNKIDLFFDTYDECIVFGVRDALVYILE